MVPVPDANVLTCPPVAPVPVKIDVPFLVNSAYGYASWAKPNEIKTVTRILLEALVGVMLAAKPETSAGVAEVLLACEVKNVLTTCNTEPAGKPAVDALLSNVPLLSGSVSVRSVLLLGAAIVNVPEPDTSGASEILDNFGLFLA